MPSRTVEVAASDLKSYLDGLSRLRMENLTINVAAGTVPGTLSLEGFYGPGLLIITGATENDTAIENGITIKHCSNAIRISQFDVRQISDDDGVGVRIISDGRVELLNLFIHSENSGFSGVQLDQIAGSTLIYKCTISNFWVAVYGSGFFILNDCEGSNNHIGISAENGIAILYGSTPELMGGDVNEKLGGLIVKSGGTLL